MTLERLVAGLSAGLISTAAAAAFSAAVAMPLTPAAAPLAASVPAAPVELAHGCHRGILRDYSGWHFHTGACVRRNVPPPGLYDNQSYRRYYRTPVCVYRCRQVGPVKQCRQICR